MQVLNSAYSYPLTPDETIPLSSQTAAVGGSKRSALTSHENPSNGTLVLGHTSLLTSFVLTEDEKFIISADRDEHIRVSWYPQGYVIERYCLGHAKSVFSSNFHHHSTHGHSLDSYQRSTFPNSKPRFSFREVEILN